jgi:hypothetical protein
VSPRRLRLDQRHGIRSLAHNRSAFLVIVLTGSCTIGGLAAEKTIQWQLDEGQQLRVRITQRTRTQMQIGEKTTTLAMLSAMEMRWAVDRVDPQGTMHISQAFARFILHSTDAEGETLKYDSSADNRPPRALEEIAATLRPLLNSRFQVTLSRRGELVDVQATGETESLLRDIPAYARWKKLLTRDGMNCTLRQCVGLMPEGPVELGDSWTESYQVETPSGNIRLSNTFEYQGTAEEDDAALEVIRMSTDVRRDEPRGAFDDPPEPGPSYTGSFHFDAAAGRLVRSRIRQQITSQAPLLDQAVQVTTTSTLETRIDPIEEN